MDDKELLNRIATLVAEERQLEEGHIGSRATGDQEHRLREVQVALDQAWDLLRQGVLGANFTKTTPQLILGLQRSWRATSSSTRFPTGPGPTWSSGALRNEHAQDEPGAGVWG